MRPEKIKNKNGTTSYRIQIRNKTTGKRESKSFSTRQLAIDWALLRKKEIEREALHGRQRDFTLKAVIEAYQRDYGYNIGRSKGHDLNRLKSYPIAEVKVAQLSAKHLIDHCQMRRAGNVQPQTVKNDVVWLKSALRTMSVTLDYEFPASAFDKAAIVLKQQKLVGKSAVRERTLSFREVIDLAKFFKQRNGYTVPMLDIFLFALFSSRRLSEITRIEWADNNDAKKTGLVKDVKHPTKKAGNHKRFRYDDCAWRIVQRQPRRSACIFPYHPDTISRLFTEACKILQLQDLRFHDLRHCALSRLARKGYHVDELRHFSLHDSYKDLFRYVNTKPEDIN